MSRIKNYIKMRKEIKKHRKQIISEMTLEERIAYNVAKDKCFVLIALGFAFICIGIFYLMIWLEISKAITIM